MDLMVADVRQLRLLRESSDCVRGIDTQRVAPAMEVRSVGLGVNLRLIVLAFLFTVTIRRMPITSTVSD